MLYILAYFIFLADDGAPQNVAGPGVAYLPYATLSTGLGQTEGRVRRILSAY